MDNENGIGGGEGAAERWAWLVAWLVRELRLELRVRCAGALLALWRQRRWLLQRLRCGRALTCESA